MIFSILSGKGKLASIKKNTSGMRRRSIIGVTKRRKNFIALWPNKRFIGTEAIQISQLMAAGEFPLGIVYALRIESMRKSGAPVEWVKTSDPVFVSLSPVAVAAKARHPNSAKLLMDFLICKRLNWSCGTPTDCSDVWISNLWCRRSIPAR